MFADVSGRNVAQAFLHTRTLVLRSGILILLEATDAPISARVSFVIRENVNQSPGPRRLLLLLASFFLLYLLATRYYKCLRLFARVLAFTTFMPAHA